MHLGVKAQHRKLLIEYKLNFLMNNEERDIDVYQVVTMLE